MTGSNARERECSRWGINRIRNVLGVGSLGSTRMAGFDVVAAGFYLASVPIDVHGGSDTYEVDPEE